MKITVKNILLALCFFICSQGRAQEATFSNPILPSGADPYSTFYKGFYYYTNSSGNRIILRKSKSLLDLKDAERKVIWTPPANTMHSKELWAPEVQRIDGKWYAYYAADDGDNNHHRMFVVENESEDPFEGEWVFKGKLATPSDKWAIDGDVFKYKGQLYMIWSGWEGDQNGEQDIFIARMKNPYTLEGERVKISSPVFDWERHWKGGPEVYVNEGPQFLSHGDQIFIVYSASGCWTDYYCLGMTRLVGSDLMNPGHWKKAPEPLFVTNKENGVYSPGHNCFVKSPDGTEDWFVYHANDNPGDGCGGKRSPRMQRFGWDKNGNPVLGIPVSRAQKIPVPSK